MLRSSFLSQNSRTSQGSSTPSKEAPASSRQRGEPATPARIPSLDGLRAFSISLVLLFHLLGTRNFLQLSEDDLPFDIGNFGVVIFFVISGYLITTLLLTEMERSGTVSLPRFYFRRTARIFPTYYAYLFIIFLVSLLGHVTLPTWDMIRALTYTSNFADSVTVLRHTWSLSVEEQFYLLWPATLKYLGRRRALIGAFGFVLFAPVFRVGLFFTGHYHGALFPAVGDSIAIGCLLAGFRTELEAHSLYARLMRSRLFILVPVILLWVLWARHILILSHAVFQSMENVLIALCLHRCLMFPGDAVGRILNSRPLVYIGTLSYSIYVFQQPFLNRESTWFFASFPINLVCAAGAALAAHYLVEQPVLAWRARFDKRATRTVEAPQAVAARS